jgi:hypothetical protein
MPPVDYAHAYSAAHGAGDAATGLLAFMGRGTISLRAHFTLTDEMRTVPMAIALITGKPIRIAWERSWLRA